MSHRTMASCHTTASPDTLQGSLPCRFFVTSFQGARAPELDKHGLQDLDFLLLIAFARACREASLFYLTAP